jgi:hypothetical protein
VKHVIRPHMPMRKGLSILLFLSVILFLVLFAMNFGDLNSARKIRELSKEVHELIATRKLLEFEIAKMRRSEEITQGARREGHQNNVALQSRLAELESELEFYRDVVGGVGVHSIPQVKGLRITRLEGPGRYGYKLVLTYLNKTTRVAEGSLALVVYGDLDGVRTGLKFSEIVESGPQSLDFSFKRFFMFEGTFKIPEGFVARQIEIEVTNSSRKRAGYKETYDWESAIN